METWNAHRVRSQTRDYQCVLTSSCPIQPNATHQITQGPLPILSSGVNFRGIVGNPLSEILLTASKLRKKNPLLSSPHSHEKSLLIGSLKDGHKVLCPVCWWKISTAPPVANTRDVVFGVVGVELSLSCGLFKPGRSTSLGTEGRPREGTSKRCATLGRARAPGAIGPEPHVPMRSSSPGPERLQVL